MAETVTKIRVFTIADFKEEEVWLREMAQSGLFVRGARKNFFDFFKKALDKYIEV